MQRVQWFIGGNKSTTNTLIEQKSKMDTKYKDFLNMKCLLAYEDSNLLLNLRSPRVGSFAPVVHVLDRKLLERLMSPSPKSQVMFASAFSWIGDFFRIFGIHIHSYGEFVEFSLRFTAAAWAVGRSRAVAVCQRVHYIILKYGTQVVFHCSRCEPSEFESAHYTKIGDAGVRRRGLWTSLGSGPRWEIGDTMQNLTWRR